MFTPERIRAIKALYRNSEEGTMGHTLFHAVEELEEARSAEVEAPEEDEPCPLCGFGT